MWNKTKHNMNEFEYDFELFKSVQIQTLLRYKFYKRLKWNVIGMLRNSQPSDILSTYGYPSSVVHHIREVR